MKFGLMFANAGPFSEPATAVGLAQLAEELGFESLWTVEHVVVPTGYQSAYPYSPTGKMPGGEDVPIPDPLIWLAYVAAATTRIRLATGILILPQRNPVILAKELATLDRLSGGRVELGVGVGWLEEEFDALGVPFAARGRRTDEYIDVLRRCGASRRRRSTVSSRSSRRSSRTRSPPTPDGPPIHIGGHTAAAARGAPVGSATASSRAAARTTISSRCSTRCARPPRTRVATPTRSRSRAAADSTSTRCERYADAGVSRFIVPPLGFDLDTLRTQLGNFSENVIAHAT